jgi:hypothetical protein
VLVAVNGAPLAPAGTITDAGTPTASVLLARPTARPPVAAAEFRVTLQPVELPAVIDAFVQLSFLTSGIALPVSLTFLEFVELALTASWLLIVDKLDELVRWPLLIIDGAGELVLSVSSPFTFPAAFGLSCTIRVADWPGFSVIGMVASGTEKPGPVMVIESIETGASPVDETISGCEYVPSTFTVLKSRTRLLTSRFATNGLSCRINVCERPERLAVRFAVWSELTAEYVPTNPELLDPAGIVTLAGTTIAALSLVKLTVTSVAATLCSETVHESVPAAVSEVLAHVSPLKPGGVATMGLSCSANVCDVPEELAVNVAA